MKMNDKQAKQMLDKLDILIKLDAHAILKPDSTLTEAIIKLDKMGLRPIQIAEVLDTTVNYVNSILSKKRHTKQP